MGGGGGVFRGRVKKGDGKNIAVEDMNLFFARALFFGYALHMQCNLNLTKNSIN